MMDFSVLPEAKVCPRCEKEKPADEFYVTRRGKTGALRLGAYCKPCNMAYNREYKKRKMADPEYREKDRQRRREWREHNREHVRRYHSEYLRRRLRTDPDFRERKKRWDRESTERRRQDPARRERERQKAREQYAIRQDKKGAPIRVRSRMDKRRSTGLPIEPFREWLRWFLESERDDTAAKDKRYATAYVRIAWALGGSEESANRAVYRWLNESRVVPLDMADAVLTRLDSPARLYELWPELAEEAAA